MKTWAIIPARSGSKRLKDKNILDYKGKPLLAHSIEFAKTLSFIDEIILSTDSEEYAKIGLKYGAKIPFLRSATASSDTAMEEDVLFDLRNQLIEHNFDLPDLILWLRPTHPIRSKEHFEQMFKLFLTGDYDSVAAITPADYRIFHVKNGIMEHVAETNYFNNKSMQRSQDMPQAYNMFHGELFRFPSEYNPRFLGNKIGTVVLPREFKLDIDYKSDLI
jgi:CMP-N-acetylneuraminic acid synthetase